MAPRFEHCNFTEEDALASFLLMLFYDNVIESVSGVASFLPPEQLAGFEARARAVGLPYRLGGAALAVRRRQPQ